MRTISSVHEMHVHIISSRRSSLHHDHFLRKRDQEDYAKEREERRIDREKRLREEQEALQKSMAEERERKAREMREAIEGRKAEEAEKEKDSDKKPKRSQAELNAMIQKIPEGEEVFR